MTTLLGWLGAGLALVSYAQTKTARLRQISILASMALLCFNLLLGIWSNVALESTLGVVNLYRLMQLRSPVPQRHRSAARRIRVGNSMKTNHEGAHRAPHVIELLGCGGDSDFDHGSGDCGIWAGSDHVGELAGGNAYGRGA